MLPASGKEPHLELSVALERAAVAEILSLLQGRNIGLGGFVTSRARLVGPVSNIAITGRLELDELERWGWLLPGISSPGFDFIGSLNFADQTLEIETRSSTATAAALPLSVRFRATRLRADTRWAATVTARGLPLASLRSLAQETGSSFPLALPLDGAVTGAVGFSPASGFRGQVRIDNATLALAGVPPLAFENLTLVANGPELHMGPANVVVAPGQTARIEGRFTVGTPAMDVRMVAAGVHLAHLQSGWIPFTGAPLPRFFGSVRGGTLKGALRFVRTSEDDPDSWSGDVELSDFRLAVPGVDQPVQVELAALRLKGQEVSLAIHEGRYREIPFQATFTATRLSLNIPRIAVGEIEAALAPSLRRSQGFLARALRIGSTPAPEWLRTRQLVATVRIGELDAHGVPIENLRARLSWDGARLDIREFSGNLHAALLSGRLTARLDGPEPTWQGQVQLDRYPWREGRLDVDAALESSGLGATFLANLRLDGEFHHRDEAGCFTITGVQEGRLTLELSSPQRTLRVGSADLALAK
jgi:hypothetical protein